MVTYQFYRNFPNETLKTSIICSSFSVRTIAAEIYKLEGGRIPSFSYLWDVMKKFKITDEKGTKLAEKEWSQHTGVEYKSLYVNFMKIHYNSYIHT